MTKKTITIKVLTREKNKLGGVHLKEVEKQETIEIEPTNSDIKSDLEAIKKKLGI